MTWSFIYTLFFSTCILSGTSLIVPVDRVPEILPYEASGRVTSTAMVLGQPLCYFNSLTRVPCAEDTCEVWAAIASGPGIGHFDTDKLDDSVPILQASPYPAAFTTQSSKRYFIAKLGTPKDFPCRPSSGIRYFRIGAEGNCTTANCNGVLPPGSTVRVRYILIDPVSRKVVSESKWSQPISLTSTRSWGSIDEWMGKRSGGMVVITVISSCLLTALLLLLGAAMLLDCMGAFRGGHDITTSPGTFGRQ